MASFTDELKALNADRHATQPYWYKDNYEKALASLEKHSAGKDTYYYDPVSETAALTNGKIQTFDGSLQSADGARDEAFRLLALADCSETFPA